MFKNKWFEKSFRRNLVDMHIPDWNEEFLSKLDPEKYVQMMILAKVQSAMVYSNSHTGDCLWPTKTGHMHNGLKGKDFLGETIKLCHKKKIHVVIYHTVVYNNWVSQKYPEWRIVDSSGKATEDTSRYGTLCPNSPYINFILEQINELCSNYDFEGIFFDMTFWPAVCYCKWCQEKYKRETGNELPRIINWFDAEWLKFQNKREQWLNEFVAKITEGMKKHKPEVSVNHQFAPIIMGWQYGVPLEIADNCDYLGGDFYGGPLQQIFVSNIFSNITKNKPFEFHSSRCITLYDHTTNKSEESLKLHTYLALAHQNAFMFIDAIDPIGTLDKKIYKKIGKIWGQTKKYEKYLYGEPVQDIGIYFSTDSKISFDDNGKDVISSDLTVFENMPHRKSCINVCETLLNNHILFGIVTKKNLKELSKYKLVILPNVLMIGEEEITAFRDYVKNGGNLYISKYTSLFTKDGKKHENFLLSDIMGVLYIGETKEKITYITLNEDANKILKISLDNQYSIPDSQLVVKTNSNDTKVLANLTLPYTDPADIKKFSSIHSNPPGKDTEYPSIVVNSFGKGKACYVSGTLESITYEPHRLMFLNLIKHLCNNKFSFELLAPEIVKMTVFHQKEDKRFLISLVNCSETQNISIHNLKINVNFDLILNRIINLTENKKIKFLIKKKQNILEIPELRDFLMILLEYKD